MLKNVFRTVAVKKASKQIQLVDALTEESPILAMLPMQASSDGLKNAYEKVISITGAKLLPLDGVLPTINKEGTLSTTTLSLMGGQIEVGEDKANEYGGHIKYFADQMPLILRETGNAIEQSIFTNSFRDYCLTTGNFQSAGGALADKMNTMVCVKYTPGETIGLYNENGFGRGQVFDMLPLSGGAVYKDSNGVLVYGMRIKSHIGIQLAHERNVSAIVNIDLTPDGTSDTGYKALPTLAQINKMIRDARGNPANTAIYCNHAVMDAIGEAYKGSMMSLPGDARDFNTALAEWKGISIIPSYNIEESTEEVVS